MPWSLAVPASACFTVGSVLSLAAVPLSVHGFYVPTGVAPSLHQVRTNGVRDLEYEIDESFPSPRFIGLLQDTLRSAGWSVPTLDPLNPEAGPSLVKLNWGRWEDTGRLSPIEHVYIRDWQCAWLNGQGDLVRYVLGYRRPSSASSWSSLKVVAVYWPSKVLTTMQARLKEKPRQ
jgi:hypothetical protein